MEHVREERAHPLAHALIGDHALGLGAQPLVGGQLPALGRVEQLDVRRRVPQEEREPRGHLIVVVLAGGVRRLALPELDAVEEEGRLEQRREAEFEPLVEVPEGLGGGPRDGDQVAELGAGQQAAPELAADLREEALRAAGVDRAAGRAAHQRVPIRLLAEGLPRDLEGRRLVLLHPPRRHRGAPRGQRGGQPVDEGILFEGRLHHHDVRPERVVDRYRVLIAGEPPEHTGGRAERRRGGLEGELTGRLGDLAAGAADREQRGGDQPDRGGSGEGKGHGRALRWRARTHLGALLPPERF